MKHLRVFIIDGKMIAAENMVLARRYYIESFQKRIISCTEEDPKGLLIRDETGDKTVGDLIAGYDANKLMDLGYDAILICEV